MKDLSLISFLSFFRIYFNSSSSMVMLTMVENSIAGSLTSAAAAVPSGENSKRDEHAIPFYRAIPWHLFDANAASERTDPSLVSRRGNLLNLT